MHLVCHTTKPLSRCISQWSPFRCSEPCSILSCPLVTSGRPICPCLNPASPALLARSPCASHTLPRVLFATDVVPNCAQSVMCSFNSANGIPTCGDKGLLTTILRDTFGFNGFVMYACVGSRCDPRPLPQSLCTGPTTMHGKTLSPHTMSVLKCCRVFVWS